MADPAPRTAPQAGRRRAGMAMLALGALGVVFGDIGTSPLYALQTLFAANGHAVKPTHADVYGVISLVFWTITLVVSIKFVTFIMRADNDGEGGIMALIALVQTAGLRDRRVQAVLVAAGLFGVALFYGDGMITPAISVLSAVEGLQIAAPGLESAVVPITIAVLAVLFLFQRVGTHAIGRLFGPVMAVWFVVLAVAGVGRIAGDASILQALSPTWGVDFFTADPGVAFVSLGSVVLTVTGAEALYADMGHFGRAPISRAWFLLVFPALTLNYLGQGALILDSPSAISNPFYLLFPHWARLPMVLLATVATVIASQAVISGAFSVTRQAVQLGFLPRMTIRHTSIREIGQVYAPAINWGLFAAVVALVVGFGSSTALGSAYGIAVTGTMAIDTLLFVVVVRALWHRPLWMAITGAAVFLTVDLAFFTANLGKVVHGGWFPLTVGAIVFVLLSTWAHGRRMVTRVRTAREGRLVDFVQDIEEMRPPLPRIPGTAVYLKSPSEATPLALHSQVDHAHLLFHTVIVLSIETTKQPYVAQEDRLRVDDLGHPQDHITHLTARFGFQDVPDVPGALALSAELGLERDVDVEHAVYYLSQINLVLGDAAGMARWRKRLFVAMARNAASPVGYFCLPPDRTITVGSQVLL